MNIPKSQCPQCGRMVKTVDGRIVNHREREDARGYADGPFCSYTEIKDVMTKTTNPPLCRCCRTEPCKINQYSGEYGKKCKKCAAADAKRTLAKYHEKKNKTMAPESQFAYSLLEAERKLNDEMVEEIKILKAATRSGGRQHEKIGHLNNIVTALEKDNLSLIGQIDELRQQIAALKDKYEPSIPEQFVIVSPPAQSDSAV